MKSAGIRKILYATDLSAGSRHAFAFAVKLARDYDARIIFLHIMPEKPRDMDLNIIGSQSIAGWDEIRQEYYARARAVLRDKSREHQGEKVKLRQKEATLPGEQEVLHYGTDEIIVVSGNIVNQILSHAQKSACDLIVMGAHEHGRLHEALFGSTASRIIHNSPIPVLVVRLPTQD